jgi:trans-aconitate 2-methyltransferase
MPRSDWDPEQYERFRDERRAPFLDLVALVRPRPGLRVLDLGCGTGELTRLLHDRLGARETVGVDRSPAMLARSAAFVAPGLRFVEGDMRDWPGGERFDVIVSNAALHWLPDHPALLARLRAGLLPGGQLAVQMPANFDHPSHTTAAAVAAEAPFAGALEGFVHPVHVDTPEAYAALIHRLGFAAQHVRLQVYGHVLAAREDVVEWVQGTLLTAYRERLPEALWPEFLARYRERLLPQLADGRPFFFPFKRVLFWAAWPA